MNTLLLEDPFEDVFTSKMQIVTYQKNRKVTKIKIHTKKYTITITIEKIDRQVCTAITYMYYLKIANYIDLLTIYSNEIHDLIIILSSKPDSVVKINSNYVNTQKYCHN